MRSLPLVRRCALLALCALLAMAGTSFGQAVLGTIQGTITDSSGAALPGVSVELVNSATGITRTTTTDEGGRYKAASLQPGVYNITATLDGFQTTRREDVRVQVGQVIDAKMSLGIEEVSEVITVTSDSPLVEVSRSSAASYVSEEEIESLPIAGRDFKEFAFLAPTVQNDSVRGFVTMSGQRGIYSGLNIDGTDAKSAFFGYGRGGESTENDGLVVAQDSVKEFQVITNGFAPEYGANAGGYINVVTKSGTNNLNGSAFYFFRDDSLAEDLPGSPLDDARGNDGSRPVDAFEVENYGLSVGGPIAQDRTHFFLSYDQVKRDDPITRSLFTPGVFDAIALRGQTEPGFLALLDGYDRNPDGTATGLFLRSVDNIILFGKVDHQFNESNSATLRINYTDYERNSTFQDEESLKLEETQSIVGSVVSVIGARGVNEFRIQSASDDLDRLSLRVGQEIEAQVRFRFGSRDSVGKFDFLPIFAEEEKLQVQNNFSYLFGAHDLKFGIDYQKDELAQLFAGSLDGRYDFNSIEDFLNNNASNARINFGDVTFPNYDESQELLGVYAQDSWKPNGQLTLNFGFRYNATYNPDNLDHIFPEGRDIPDDTDNFAPRLGFAYSLNDEGTDVIRGGVGLFFGRTPTLLFASQVQQNGLYPNFGRINVQPGDIGFVPLGQPIDNENPPLDAPNSPSFIAPDFEDQETWRVNLGYERQLQGGWAAGVDAIYAEGSNLQSNIERNRTFTLDEFGRPNYDSTRPNSEFNELFVRQSIGESEYTALTFKINKRFNGRFQLQAHYTWSEDKDTDSNERSATSVTVSIPNNINYDWGLSDRDVENRVVFSGLVVLPGDIRVSGIAEYRDGTPYSLVDGDADFSYCGGSSLGFNCPDTRPIINGQVVERNSARNESITRIDLRVSKFFEIGNVVIDLFGEAFNLLDENSFAVTNFNQRDPSDDEFGIANQLITTPRQFQLGLRLTFK